MHFYPRKPRSKASRDSKAAFKSSEDDNKSSGRDNKLENKYYKDFLKLKKSIPCWDEFFTVSEQERIDNWPRLEVMGNAICEKYAWAVPDSRALKILKHFRPLIEIGAGKGYFSKLLSENGVDIIAFDREVDEKSWSDVQIGGPKKLSKKIAEGRNLFLCYPDEDSSMACPCLDYFEGEYVIHIGELASTGTISSPQAPWGRTSSAEFQVALMSEYNCVLVAEMPAFPFSRDCISVWKRTEWVRGKESIEKEMNDDNEDESEEGDEEGDGGDDEDKVEEDDAWASIPSSERLPVTRAAPDFEFLLE